MSATDDEFDGFESAELMHARGLPTAEAERICARYLEQGTWKRAPREWTLLADRSARREDATRDRLGWFEAWVDAVSQEGIEAEHDEALHSLLGWGLLDDGADASARLRVGESLVAWLCEKADPGSAGCIAYVLSRVYLRTRQCSPPRSEAEIMGARIIADVFTPVARRMVEVGVAELRSQSEPQLIRHIVAALERSGPSELLVAAFEIMVAAGHEHRLWYVENPNEHELWWLTEAALAAGLSPTRCWDIVSRTELDLVRRIWAPLLFVSFPHCANALLTGLACAGIPEKTARQGWVVVVLTNEPEDLQAPLTQQAALLLVDVLQQDVVPWADGHEVRRFLEGREEVDRERVSRWVVFAATTVLKMAGRADAREAQRFVAHHLTQLVRWAPNMTDEASNRAFLPRLREWIEAAESEDRALVLAARILRDNPSPNHAVSAAFECLSIASPKSAAPASDEWLASLRVEFERFVSLPWNEPVFGIDVDAVLGGVSRVEFRADEQEQVSVHGATMHLRPDYYRDVFRRHGSGDEARALCMLYFVHELLHIPQGIGEFAAVQRLRAVGAELTLMHLDLTADHVALLLTHRAAPRWPVTWLERLVSTSLESFPASSFHTHAARHRKAVRLVSTRADLLARERYPRALERMGYLFVDYAPGGGGLFLLAYGPPQRVLAEVEISADESRLLNEAADPRRREGYAVIDVVLERLLAAWKPGRGR